MLEINVFAELNLFAEDNLNVAQMMELVSDLVQKQAVLVKH